MQVRTAQETQISLARFIADGALALGPRWVPQARVKTKGTTISSTVAIGTECFGIKVSPMPRTTKQMLSVRFEIRRCVGKSQLVGTNPATRIKAVPRAKMVVSPKEPRKICKPAVKAKATTQRLTEW